MVYECGCFRYDLKMRRLKQFLIFLLVVITIYSTLLFYLLMSVQADSRLQEIDYIEKTKHEHAERVIYMDRIVHLIDRYTISNTDFIILHSH